VSKAGRTSGCGRRRRRIEIVWRTDAAAPDSTTGLTAEPAGYFSGLVPGLQAGGRYRFRLDGGRTLYPDPASRFQPDGPHGPSQVVDPTAFRWGDEAWPA
jgi:maltooligosyltrehalose trehalohydrolase